MNQNLVTIEVTDETSLLRACDILHDARFDVGNAMADMQAGRWTGVFVREFFEDATLLSELRGIIFTKVTFPMAESVLELGGIADCDVLDSSHLGTYTFSECQSVRGKYRFFFCEGMEIVFTFKEKPTGRLRDIRLLDERGSYLAIRNPFRRRLTNRSSQLAP
jgi:hypothetical protein